MATIPFVTAGAGQKTTAALWNAIFAELDAKITEVMDGKTFLATGDMHRLLTFIGKPFLFVNGDRPISFWIVGQNYDHAPFTAAAAELETDLFDAENKVVVLRDLVPQSYQDQVGAAVATEYGFFNQSLEAHTQDYEGEPHYIMEGLSAECRWRYAQAELVIEGDDLEEIQLPANPDKFSFFRAHNLNDYEVTVKFPGYDLVVPPWGIKCVRRTAVGTYLAGWNYFNRFQSKDPKFAALWVENFTPWGSMGGNNVISPLSIGYRVIEYFRDRVSPRLRIDPHTLYDVGSLYTGLFADAGNDATVLGDLLVHEGPLLDIRTYGDGSVEKKTVQFAGFSDLKTRWPVEEEISVTVNGDGTITLGSLDTEAVTHDLYGIGTNLLCSVASGGYQVRPGVNLKTGAVLASHNPGAESDHDWVTPAIQAVNGADYSYSTLGVVDGNGEVPILGEVEVELDHPYTTFAAPDPSSLTIHSDTVGQVLTLADFGSPDHTGSSQDTTYGSFTDRALVLTPFGLMLRYKLKIPLAYLPPGYLSGAMNTLDLPPIIHAWYDDRITLTSTHLEYDKLIPFNRWGWAHLERPENVLGAWLLDPAAAIFVSPRRRRYVRPVTEQEVFTYDITTHEKESLEHWKKHPIIEQEPYGPSGEDFKTRVLTPAEKLEHRTEIRILTPLGLAWAQEFAGFSPFKFPILANPDTLPELLKTPDSEYADKRAALLANTPEEVAMVGANFLAEHYNSLANYVNAITAASPFTFQDRTQFYPNTGGPFGGRFCPANQYASFAENSPEWDICVAWGIPIKTKDDLPSSYATVKNTVPKFYSVGAGYYADYELTSTEYFEGPFEVQYVRYNYDITLTLGAVGIQKQTQTGSLLSSAIFQGSGSDETFYWVTIEDVKSAAEAAGFLFQFERLAVPYKLQIFEAAGTVTLLSASANSEVYPWNEEFGLAGAPPPRSGTTYHPPVYYPEAGSGSTGQALEAVMIPCIEGETPEWIAEGETWVDGNLPYAKRLKLVDYREGDYQTGIVTRVGDPVKPDGFATVIVRLSYGADEWRFLRQNPNLIRNPEVNSISTVNAGLQLVPSLYYQSVMSTGLDTLSKVILKPAKALQHTTQTFSSASYRNALGRLTHGPTVLPFELLDTDGASVVVEPITGTTLLTPPDSYAYDVLIFRDHSIRF
jgi:hypothetical protein